MAIANPQQLSFVGGVNAQAAPDKINDGEVITATNIDFSKEIGAASIRRGSIIYDTIVYGSSTSTVAINTLFRNYNNPTNISQSPFYAVTAGGAYRGIPGTWTQISTFTGAGKGAIGTFSDYTLIGLEVFETYKDDGTNVTDWIKQAPASPVALSTIAVSTAAVLSTGSIIEGSGSYNSGTWTAIATDTTYRVVLEGVPSSTNLSTISSVAIGDYGVDYLSISFTNPSAVYRISRDYSIGGTSFTNYFHAEAYPGVDVGTDLLPGIDVYLQSQPIEGTDTAAPIGRNQRNEALTGGRGEYTRPATEGLLGRSPSTLYNWAIARPNFQMVGQYVSTSGANPWSNIGAVRITVECTSTCEVKAGNWYLQGDEQHSLSDPQLGYNYWVSYATLDTNGNLIDESASSPVLQNVRMSQGQPTLLHTDTVTGSHGITHRVWYRQGGLLSTPYAISTQTALDTSAAFISTATLVDTLPDIKAITAGWILQDAIYGKADFPGIPSAIVEYQGRVFVAFENYIMWSLPGKVGTFPKRSIAAVSGVGDEVKSLHVMGNNLVIVNRDSIYVFRGSILEGADQNWVLSRSGSRHGSKAGRVSDIKTPYGIPILDYDGLFMFDPGSGMDQEIPWLMNKIGDVFRGNGTSDPAALKGTRVPPLNKAYIIDSMAVYTDGKLYLGMPAEAADKPSIMYVIEFATQRVWIYDYNLDFIAGMWDFIDNKLLITSRDNGRIMQIEQGQFDESSIGGIFNKINYSIKPKMLTGSSDFRLENLSIELKGGTSTVKVIADSTATITAGTFTNAVRDWQIPPLNGSLLNNLQITLEGYPDVTEDLTIWGVGVTAINEPEQVRFWRTEYKTTDNTEQRFDVYFADYDIVGTGTVTTTVYVDGTAVATGSHIGPTNGRRVFPVTIPIDSFGYVAWAISTSSSDALRIKPFNGWFSTRPEPPRINSYKTDIESLEEHIIDAFDVDINPNGTATAIVYIDNVATSTFTFVGTAQQSYTRNLIEYPTEIYGRTMYVTYTGSGFKHFKTWWHRRPEPDRWTSYDTTTFTYASEQYIKTWVATINAMGTTTATLYLDNVAVQTATLTGTHKQVYNIGVDTSQSLGPLSTATTAVVVYRASAGNYMKHYDTKLEVDPKPFGKLTWSVAYKRIGGSRRLDHAQHWSADIEVEGGGTATITSHWYCDQRLYSTATLVISGREWREWIPMPPDGRGYLFEQRVYGSAPFRMWRSTLDVLTEGAKGVARATYIGTPNDK